jgi:hypothetical protein
MKLPLAILIGALYVAILGVIYSEFEADDRITKLENQRPPCSHVISDTTIYLSNGKSDTMVMKRILH